ncbi:TLP18.3, Psb32 and MOLO-1 founding protein of phosphatase [Fontimonas thermophila]|uniref:TLP18.3, Psb32 and MOLO-1 founding protein of phosphatase n=1 Tax=Fontimonas thermophila TaxID=1076937 RepID=A0A1I2KFK1_9GAMM|nr:TPM domain-containing protein [Fontimonas thermophila]SFF65148.1 TLP18.3, Psb32 and MOLO-1 founding protein of phosphatase [Fontimonas thermophila]
MDVLRMLRHLCVGDWWLRRTFPPSALAAIERAIRACEERHAGEIRFVVETALPWAALRRGVTPRERALEVFALQGVWDTEHNNGVLIFVLLADRDVEIVADRGVAGGRVAAAEWEACCRVMEQHFREGRFLQGAIAGIEAVAEVLRRHPPGRKGPANELPDAPVVL